MTYNTDNGITSATEKVVSVVIVVIVFVVVAIVVSVVFVVSVVVKREGDSLEGYTKRSGRNRGRSPRLVVRIRLPVRQYLVTLLHFR